MARLERVLGCTACSRSLAVDPLSGIVAYPAGSALVLNNPRSQCRVHLLSPGKCQLTCLTWSPCGQFIATGEFGTDPKVRVWSLRQIGSAKAEPECELGWHKLGISCVGFSPDSELLISVGNNHDKQILVWDWRRKRRVAESRLTCQVNALGQSDSGRIFVTVGVRHVKFWYVERSPEGTVLLQGRSAILAEHRNNTFIDCCCAPGQRTFALTLSRLLVEFVDKRLVNLYQMGQEVPFSLALGPGLLFLGFGEGTIRALDLAKMEPICEFGRPHPLHRDLAPGGEGPEGSPPLAEERKFPDVHCLAFHPPSGVLTALYSDRSLYHWLLQPGQRPLQPLRLSSQLFHVGPVFDLEVGPGDSFFTAGADETVRFWSLNRLGSPLGQGLKPLSPELRKMLFLNAESDSLTERPDKNFGGIISDTLESTTGVRCISFSADGEHLACGKKNGNICVFDLAIPGWPCLADFEAHEGEVLCLDYSPKGSEGGVWLLASGSRDRLVHLFDAFNQYTHLLTMDEHTGPVVGCRFVPSSSSLLLATFGTDQLVLCRQLLPASSSPSGFLSSRPIAQMECPQGPACLAVTPQGTLFLGCQDRLLREFDSGTGKLLRTVERAACEEGARITKLCLDPSGTFAASLCSDKSVHVQDLDNGGECSAVLGLPSDCVTGMAFSADCRRLVLVSYSGSISIWRLSAHLQRRMVAKLAPTLDRCASSDSLGSAADSLFGSLASLENLHSATTTSAFWTGKRAEGDDELDSGIGGGGSAQEGQPQQQRFELRRVQPQKKEEEGLGGGVGGGVGEEEEAVPVGMFCPSPSPMLVPARHHPPAPPPYPTVMASQHGQQQVRMMQAQQQHLNVFNQQQQQQQNSRSMSNLHSTTNGQQQMGLGRRRWKLAEGGIAEEQQQGGMVAGPSPVHASSPFAQLGLPLPPENVAQQRFGISNSVSLSAIRGQLVGGAGGPVQLPPSAQPWPSSPGPRNSLSRRFLQNGQASADQPVWTPGAKSLLSSNRRRSSNLFHHTNVFHGSASLQPIASPGTSSPGNGSPSECQSGGRRLFQSVQAGEGGGGSSEKAAGARLALNRIKQRRTGEETLRPEPTTALGPSPLRSRSQSPSQLAMAFLAQGAAQQQNKHRPKALSPSGRSAVSSTSSPSSCQTRLSSLGASRLQQARQRLKKSQENLATLEGDESFPGTRGRAEEREGEGPLARSRSIGNLRLSKAVENEGCSLSEDPTRRQMAKSVTNLMEGTEDGLGRLADCRQRLAQSIRNIHRINESDLQPLSTPHSNESGPAGTSLDSSWHSPATVPRSPRRGVQKKLDRFWPQAKGQTDLAGTPDEGSSSTGASALLQPANSPRWAGADHPMPLRSASTLVASARSPRSNYLAQKLAGRGPLDSVHDPPNQSRSLSAELGHASAGLANAGFASAGSKRMAMHAQECIREMQQACDKLLGTRQLIRVEPAISLEEKRRLLANVNRAVAAFAQRLEMENEQEE